MFNEDVLEEFTNANPGKDVSILDLEHIQKPLSLKIINGRVSRIPSLDPILKFYKAYSLKN